MQTGKSQARQEVGGAGGSPLKPQSSVPSQRKCFGLCTRKERWGLSLGGWLLLLGILLACGGAWVVLVYPFLAETDRVDANILVAEGWIHEFGALAASHEFKNGAYQKIYTTGGPMEGTGSVYTSDGNTVASLGASMLRNVGLPADAVQMTPSHVAGRDRTYSSAVALRDWLRARHIEVRGVNVISEGAHARRTRLLFQEAFGDQVPVGVISATSPDFNPKRWWHYSEGVRETIGETIAYLYAKLCFHPPAP
jgi:uncharacterized SAM-binding protein YcdF (DUF218 family)